MEEQLFYAKLGNLYVTNISLRYNNVTFTTDKDETIFDLGNKEIQWLVNNVDGIEIVKVTKLITEEKVELSDDLIF